MPSNRTGCIYYPSVSARVQNAFQTGTGQKGSFWCWWWSLALSEKFLNEQETVGINDISCQPTEKAAFKGQERDNVDMDHEDGSLRWIIFHLVKQNSLDMFHRVTCPRFMIYRMFYLIFALLWYKIFFDFDYFRSHTYLLGLQLLPVSFQVLDKSLPTFSHVKNMIFHSPTLSSHFY